MIKDKLLSPVLGAGERKMLGKGRVCVVIPSRLEAERLPNKPLLDLGGVPMIVRVLRNVRKLGLGEPLLACADQEIVDAVRRDKGIAVLTDAALGSGTDRVAAALEQEGLFSSFDVIVNVQGDMPLFDLDLVLESLRCLEVSPKADVSTAVIKMDDRFLSDKNKVKAVCDFASLSPTLPAYSRVLYFSRSLVPYGGPYYLHIGVYAYRASALRLFVESDQGFIEKRERLEQLRGIQNGLSYWAALVDCEEPLAIDSSDDYNLALGMFG